MEAAAVVHLVHQQTSFPLLGQSSLCIFLAGSGDIAIDFRAYKIPGPERQSCSHNFVDSEPWDAGTALSWAMASASKLASCKDLGNGCKACHHQSLVHGDVEAADFCEETIQEA